MQGNICLSYPPRQPPSDPLRKIRFREEAREIVAKDRYDRKYGRAVDTAGAVARAMERAYRRGFEDAHSERPATISQLGQGGEGALDWVTIPPRPRNAFWTICLFSLGRDDQERRSGHLVPATTERLTDGWQLLASDGRFKKTFGERTIVPLVRLGLLEVAADPPERLLISDLGMATWWLFIHRGGHFPEDLSQA